VFEVNTKLLFLIVTNVFGLVLIWKCDESII